LRAPSRPSRFVQARLPRLAAITLIARGFHGERLFSVGINGGAHTMDLAAVLTAVSTAGISVSIFSSNGLPSPGDRAARREIRGANVPLASSAQLALANDVYVLLPISRFWARCHSELLARPAGTARFQLGPFADRGQTLGIAWLAHLAVSLTRSSSYRHRHPVHARRAHAHTACRRTGHHACEFGSVQSGLRRAARGNLVQPVCVVRVPVFLPLLGNAARRDLVRDISRPHGPVSR